MAVLCGCAELKNDGADGDDHMRLHGSFVRRTMQALSHSHPPSLAAACMHAWQICPSEEVRVVAFGGSRAVSFS